MHQAIRKYLPLGAAVLQAFSTATATDVSLNGSFAGC